MWSIKWKNRVTDALLTIMVIARIAATTTALSMANDQDFMRWARASRSAGADDNVVELNRPLGLVLNEDEQGNVYVETVAPKGNAARSGKVSMIISLIVHEKKMSSCCVSMRFCFGRTREVLLYACAVSVVASESEAGCRVSFYPFLNSLSISNITQVKEGDILTMCSATFGDEMWSTRGVGLTRVLAAIRLRAGATVSLVFESSSGFKKKKSMTEKQIQAPAKGRRSSSSQKGCALGRIGK